MAVNPGNDHWRQLEELFYAALDLDPAERAAFLDRSCGSNAEVRREVDVLLSSSEKTWGFFQKPLQEAAELITMDSEPDGHRLDDYKVIRQIGEGGMSKVYLAERADELYQQQVAIKLVQPGTGRTRDLLLRFTAERQILANLSHPNIARLLDAGIASDGSPYLVMEYIEGVAMDKYATARGLLVPERLKLFCTVCAAVEYAHRNLVVHRDIKPANILVTNEGVPKLLDFGIAKLLQSSEISDVNLTRATERLMTPECESGAGSRRSDYDHDRCLRAGRTSLCAADRTASFENRYQKSPGSCRIVCEQTPTRPSSVLGAGPAAVKNEARALRGDLDNIVLKALRKEPDRRYASVGALAEEAIAVSPENSDVIAGARNYLALVLEKKGRYQEATQLLRSTAEISASNEGTDSPSYLTAMHNLAGALSDLGNLSEAEATERKVLEIRQRVSGRGHPDTAYSLNMLGWILLEKGDWAAADPYLIASVIKIAAVTLALCRPMNFPVRYRQLSEAA